MQHVYRVQVSGIDSSATMLCRWVVEWCTGVWILNFSYEMLRTHIIHTF